jgi:hypothetical protein
VKLIVKLLRKDWVGIGFLEVILIRLENEREKTLMVPDLSQIFSYNGAVGISNDFLKVEAL